MKGGGFREIIDNFTGTNSHYFYGILINKFLRDYRNSQIPPSKDHPERITPAEVRRIGQNLEAMFSTLSAYDACLIVSYDALSRKVVDDQGGEELLGESSKLSMISKEYSSQIFEIDYWLREKLEAIGAHFEDGVFHGSVDDLYKIEAVLEETEKKFKKILDPMKIHLKQAEAHYRKHYVEKDVTIINGTHLEKRLKKLNKIYEKLSKRLNELGQMNEDLIKVYAGGDKDKMDMLTMFRSELVFDFLPSVNHEDSPIYLDGLRTFLQKQLRRLGGLEHLKACELSMILDHQLEAMETGIALGMGDDRRALYQDHAELMKKGIKLLEARIEKIEKLYIENGFVAERPSEILTETSATLVRNRSRQDDTFQR